MTEPINGEPLQLELTIFRGTADEPSLCDRKQQEYPHPEVFTSEEAELEWLHTRAQPLHLVWKRGQVNTLYLDYMPSTETFFPGAISIENVLPEFKEQKMAEANWKRRKDRILRNQETLVRTIQQEKDDRLTNKVEKNNAENAVIKANAPPRLDLEAIKVTKQQRANTRREIIRRTVELQDADQKLKEERHRLKWEKLKQAAAVGALTRNIDCLGKKKLIEEQFRRDQQRAQQLKLTKWTQLNLDRAARGIQPLLPLQQNDYSTTPTEQLVDLAKRQAEADKITADARAARKKITDDKKADADQKVAQQVAEIAAEVEKAKKQAEEVQWLAKEAANAKAQIEAQDKQDILDKAAADAAIAANQTPPHPTIVPKTPEKVQEPAILPQTAAEKALEQKRIEIANTAVAALLKSQEDLKKVRQAAAAKYLATQNNTSIGVVSNTVIQMGPQKWVQPVAPQTAHPTQPQAILPPVNANTPAAPLQQRPAISQRPSTNIPQTPLPQGTTFRQTGRQRSTRFLVAMEVKRTNMLNRLRNDLKAACRRGIIARWRITLDPTTNAPYTTIGEYLRSLTDIPIALDLDTFVEDYALSKMTMADIPLNPNPRENAWQTESLRPTGAVRWTRANKLIFVAEDWDAQVQALERWTIPPDHSGPVRNPNQNGDPSTRREI